ncbi:amino acid ABC transporter permease [Lichenihabitans sp. Uapishka_5]|uniref:amino acid ABC transporter permease n=1 Tax=Lichenihabitans sp. Uapishka_5 TaxID=3037302 RepID=UPI0029E81EA7|nr:amino acid ABC transporter permease [Lichenihabitans sp. Uapishka_5]MDX7950816.1 amino acid ABC transporter permease [Lichenihabitans sp. Uapishka_5]
MKIWDWAGFFEYLVSPYILAGAWATLWLTAVSMVCGLALGFVLALMRRSQLRLISTPAGLYIWLFRGTPLLVQLIVIYTGLPQLGIKFGVVQSALIGLSLNEAAYLAEIIRAGIGAVPPGQVRAARALGMRERQIMRYIVLPQALRIVLPPLGNSVNGLLKTTSITSVISMEELLRRTQVLIQEQFEVLELFSVAALYYLAMTTAWQLVQRQLERYADRSDAPPTAAGA